MLAPELVLELHTFWQCLHSSPLKPPGSAGFPEWETQPWWTVEAAAGAGSGPGHLDCGEAGAVGCWGVSSVRGVLEGLFISKAVTNSLSERDCKATPLEAHGRLVTRPVSTLQALALLLFLGISESISPDCCRHKCSQLSSSWNILSRRDNVSLVSKT